MQENEITESSRTVLDYLSFEADQTIQEMTIPSTPIRHGSSSDNGSNGESRPMHMQGILWKRRDVFRNRWRPRWFVLHSDQRLLTYYLLANQESERVISGGSSSTPGRRRSALSNPQSSSVSVGSGMNSSIHTNDNQESNRNRTLSDSYPHTIDCDVVPRGTIYLLESTVEANEALTVPEEDLYALTITDHENGSHCHLAARTTEARDEWIQHIRSVCQSGVPDQSLRPPELNQVQYSAKTPMPGRRTETKMIGKNGEASNENRQNKSNPSSVLQKTIGTTNNKNTVNGAGKSLLGERNSARDKEVLVVFAPVIIYKVLTMMSFFVLATLCFVLTSGLAVRWILIQHLVRNVQLLDSQDEGKNSIGDGSICCRMTEDVADICGKEGEASLPHILVSSLAKAICQQPRLASKKYKLLPPFFSTDINFLDMNQKNSDESGGIWVIKANEMSLEEIADYFNATKQQQHPQQVGWLKRFSGPACEIVLNSDEKDRDSRVHLELNLSRCPITVFVSCHTEQRKGKVANISIHFQSTDTTTCREFVESFQKSILSTTKVEKKGLW